MKIILKESQLEFLLEKYKIGDEERLKLWETEDFLLVVPLTHTASCKYGANTKWCITEKDPDMFERHYDMGSLGIVIVKNPKIADKLGNTKFAYYINRPTSEEAAKDSRRIIIYDDMDNMIPFQSFLNYADNKGYLPEIRKSIDEFVKYSGGKFDVSNFEMIKRGVANPF